MDEKKESSLEEEIGKKERRKLKAQEDKSNAWKGFGLFGLVGWSVAIPTISGVALGVWVDHHYPSQYSWTLMLLVIGVIAGCLLAMYWVSVERQRIDKGDGNE